MSRQIKNNPWVALQLLLKISTSATCAQCGADLKGQNLQRLVRKGCPKCGGTKITFTTTEEVGERLQSALGGDHA